jgi:hypothetical protein
MHDDTVGAWCVDGVPVSSGSSSHGYYCSAAVVCMHPPCFLVRSDLPWAGGALDLFVLSVSYVLQHYNIGRSMHVVFTYVAGRQQYGTCSPACMYLKILPYYFLFYMHHHQSPCTC